MFIVPNIEFPNFKTIDEWLDFKTEIHKKEELITTQKELYNDLANLNIHKLHYRYEASL